MPSEPNARQPSIQQGPDGVVREAPTLDRLQPREVDGGSQLEQVCAALPRESKGPLERGDRLDARALGRCEPAALPQQPGKLTYVQQADRPRQARSTTTSLI